MTPDQQLEILKAKKVIVGNADWVAFDVNDQKLIDSDGLMTHGAQATLRLAQPIGIPDWYVMARHRGQR